ncbi:hypothetical protein CEW83_12425 [Parazoarcus communis]|uniref:Uncharacterized protein n=1 Tax=Parazoarcus communis TaxID=41977 RepID=A0A2U8GQT5_9RHOO|nr:hypothetical protein [Parazoarcus communis]AWI75921.1 hypothetical protein CEW83_12425 [Parazoarcus communis]
MNEAEFDRHVRTGERNKEVMELMHNWCSHAQVRNHGGTGLIAMQTGLPIGMFGMQCDFAPAGGIAGWCLEEGALDFYDRNCVHCDKRQAVRLPNLSQLVGERDRELASREEAAERAKAEADAARAGRKQRRDALRTGQSPATCALLDDLQALDDHPSDEARTRIVETVKLAPEVLTAPITEYFFDLAATRAAGCQTEALLVLQHVGADPVRLAAAALGCLRRHESVEVAADIVMATPSLGEEAAVEAAVPALISLANPPRQQFSHHQRRLQPAPLEAVFGERPKAIQRAIQRLLDSRQSYAIRTGTAGLKVLARKDPLILGRFAKTLVAKLARAHLLIDDDEADRDLDMVCGDLQRSIAATFLHEPAATDQLIAGFFEGASSEGEARLIRVYEEVFPVAVRGKATLEDDVAGVVLTRVIKLASTSNNSEVLSEIAQILRDGSGSMLRAARKNLDVVLGAAAVLDARFEAFDAEQNRKTNVTTLDALEAGNFRSTLDNLRECFATIAARAAEGDRLATESYVDFLTKVDDSRTWLVSALLKETSHLISTPEGLNLVLPELYSGLMGTSTLARATAVETLGRAGKSRIADLPQLVLDAFVLLLSDRYVIVHQAAAGALENIPLPPHLEQTAGLALLQLIGAYKSEKDTRGFLPRCMRLYLHRFAKEEQLKEGLAAWFIRILTAVPPSSNLRELNSMSRYLKDQPSYVDLVISILEDQSVREYGEEDAIRLAYLIPDAEVLKRADDLAAVAVRRRNRDPYVGAMVEILTRAGAWEQAIMAVDASWEDVPDTVPKRRMKWARRMQVVAVRFEAAVAAGDAEQRAALKAEWEGLVKALDEDEKQYAARRDPLPSFLRTYRGG